jgi:hypothetical protein
MRSGVAPPPNPEHLLDQANHLTSPSAARPTDLRRAISNAYYALFHLVTTAAADMEVCKDDWLNPEYVQVYRGIQHRQLRSLCSDIASSVNPASFPEGGLDPLTRFAQNTFDLYELRIEADYNPSADFTVEGAMVAVSGAEEALKWFRGISTEQREAFLRRLLKQRPKKLPE